MKKLFHRKKTSAPSSPEQTPVRSRQTEDLNPEIGLRTSRYESTAPANLPQTGDFPLRGNNSSVSFHGRRSDTFSRGQVVGESEYNPRPSSSSPYYGSLPTPRVTSASYNPVPRAYPPADGLSDLGATNYYQRTPQNAPTEDPPTQGFSNLNLSSTAGEGDQNDFPLRQHHGPHSSATNMQGSAHLANRHARQLYGEESNSGIRMVGQTRGTRQPTEPDFYSAQKMPNTMSREQSADDVHDQSRSRPVIQSSSDVFDRMAPNDVAVRRKKSIPRKEVPHSFQDVPSSHRSVPSSSFPTDRKHRTTLSAARPNHNEGDYRLRQGEVSPDISQHNQPSAQEVLDRARGNTYDTQVVEKVASAVVHERVHQDVHHIREEVITKENHEHDVYHRILPIIDVEVLPPRHFLPVEGGGLVEISGKEVPGRGNNWVIAETASKIPSDHAAPKGSRPFSARQFLGTDGDAVQYDMLDGHQKTEQTWVHQPELEIGGRDSGQTWPMEFGVQSDSTNYREHKASKSPRSKHGRKSLEKPSSRLHQPRA
ncbi:MAG: hypothetical protein Q9216_001759 [Gyalolechia sp. 2 TL-2023]